MIYTPQNPAHINSDWFIAKVNYATSHGRLFCRSQTIDNRNPERPIQMVDDEVSTIALKCFLILLGLPFYAIGVMATHIIRCFTLIASNLVRGDFCEAFLSLVQEVWAVVKAPFYALAIEFYAALGLCWPLPIRSVIAQLERDWSGSERKDSLLLDKTDTAFFKYFTMRQSKGTIFLAHCFQPICELNNPNVRGYTITNPAL
jgi:hypothetical protein